MATDDIGGLIADSFGGEVVSTDPSQDPQVVDLSTPKIVSGTGSLLSKTDGGWKDTLSRIKSGSAKNNTIKT